MSTLYIAGDSYASIANNQTIGNSWSELLAKTLDAELVNVARPAASNLSIAIQIEWIVNRITEDDYAVVFLTDHYRETLPNQTITTTKSLLEKHSVYDTQVPYQGVNYSDPAELVSSIFTDTPSHKEYQSFFKQWFNPDLAYFRDRMVIIGSTTLLATKTKKYVVCAGGFANGRDEPVTSLSGIDLHLPPENFCDITAGWLNNTSARTTYINHMDDLTHIQLANLLHKKIKNSS
jgi:hypothetical protein